MSEIPAAAPNHLKSQAASALLLACALAFYVVSAGLTLSTADFGRDHDDGLYVVTAKSLAETGSYRIRSLPGEPPQHKYPIAFPAILSAVWRRFPEFPGNIIPLKCVSLVAGSIFLGLSVLFLARQPGIGRIESAVIVAVCAIAPATGDLANSVMSELVFGVFSLAALLVMERVFETQTATLAGVAAGLLAGGAWQTRSVGIALPAALIVAIVARRRWGLLLAVATGLMLAVGIGAGLSEPAEPVPRAYEYYVNYRDWYRNTASEVGPGFVLQVPMQNLLFGTVSLASTVIPESARLQSAGWFRDLLLGTAFLGATLTMVLAIRGIARQVLQRRPSLWALYLAGYLAVILVWPFPPPPRYFVPILPLLLLACRIGWGRLGERISGWPRQLTVSLLAVAVFTFALVGAYDRQSQNRVVPGQARYEWIRTQTPPEAVVACVYDPNCYLSTGRKAVSIAIAEVAPVYGPQREYVLRPDSILEMLKESRAQLLMLESIRSPAIFERLAREAVATLRTSHPDLLHEVWKNDAEQAVIYQVRLPVPGVPGPPAE